MKERIQKKLYVGVFKQCGNVIILNTKGEVETAETIPHHASYRLEGSPEGSNHFNL